MRMRSIFDLLQSGMQLPCSVTNCSRPCVLTLTSLSQSQGRTGDMFAVSITNCEGSCIEGLPSQSQRDCIDDLRPQFPTSGHDDRGTLSSTSLPFGSWTAIRSLPALHWELNERSVRPARARNWT